MLIPTQKSILEIIIVIISVCIIGLITYNYANTLINYLIGILGNILFITMWLKEGITSKGFTSMYRYKEIILWADIEKFDVCKTKNIKINLFGKFMEQSFRFKSRDYNKIMIILEDNLYKSIS